MPRNLLIVIASVAAAGVILFVSMRKPSETLPPLATPTPVVSASPTSRGLILEAQKGTIENIERGNSPVLAPVTIDVIARQWVFEPATIRVKTGQRVTLRINSTDVTHGIAIPEFNISENLVAGKVIDVTFTPDKAGSFDFFCSIFCGSGHKDMKGTLIVE